MNFNIIRSCGLIKIEPIHPDLLEEICFFYRYKDKIKKTFFDKRVGKIREILIDGPLKIIKKKLYSFSKDEKSIITYDGLLHRIKNYLDMNGHTYSIETNGELYVQPDVTDRVYEDLYPDQKCAVEIVLNHDGGCLVEAATNTGKTRIIASLCRAYKDYRGIVVTNRQSVALKLYQDLKGLAPECDPGIYVTSKKCAGRTIVVTSASLDKFNPDKVDFIIYDEAHGAGSETRSQNLLKFKKSIKYGFSATLSGGFRGIDKYLESIFGPIVFRLTDQQLEAMNRATPLHVYVMDVDSGPMFSNSTQNLTMEKNGVWFNRKRNKLIKECVDLCPKSQQLVIYVRTYTHLEELVKNYLTDDFEIFHGKINNKEKKRIMEGFNSGEIKRIISTDCLAEGVDPKNLYVIINANCLQSDVSVLQKAGRNRRLTDGKDFGIVIDFNDCWDDRMVRKSSNRLKHYKTKGYKIFENSLPEKIKFVEKDYATD
jgi:superfamily II DNA or RNA helicase